MHNLEHLLVILSQRIRHETGNNDLADATLTLASASHNYESTAFAEKLLADMNDDWGHRFEKLMVKKGQRAPRHRRE